MLDTLSQLPSAGGAPTSLVVMLHGVGSNKEDLIGLAPYLGPALPNTAFVSVDGVEDCDMAPMGRQWFSLSDRSPARMIAEVARTAPTVHGFLDQLLRDANINESRMALLGFSQGTMMSLNLGLQRKVAPAAIVGFSGALLAADDFASTVTSRPPVLLVHGEDDGVVPFGAMARAKLQLEGAGVKVQTLACPGLAHSIDEAGLRRAAHFLAEIFNAPR
jgi:phospholipase/carboxylesterase